MPRRAPDETVVHRVELGSWERNHLEGLLTSRAWANAVGPIVDILTSKVAMGAILLGLVTGLIPGLPSDWMEQTEGMSVNQVKDWLEPQNLLALGGGILAGGILGLGSLPALVIGLLAFAGVEASEDVIEWATDPEGATQDARLGIAATLIVATTAYRNLVDTLT